ncbi:MAG: ketoacyl-ACP synthase III [Bacteroidetes bacterium]|nr:ketoacyl-ACP synthase III [Bacteroidota bacterium]
MPSSKITGVGMYVPENIVTNHDLAKLFDTNDDWITERTGIKQRRFFKEGDDSVSKMAARASQIAIDRAGKKPEDVDLIILATLSPDYDFPGSGVLLQRKLPFRNIAALDLRAQCCGFVYGLSVADQFIKSGMYKTVLVVGSEVQSNLFEMSDRGRNMAVIFGDGAGAAVLEATDEPGKGILTTKIHSDGKFAEELYLENPGGRKKVRITKEMIDKGEFLPYMNGKLVFMNAIRFFPEVIREGLRECNLKESDLNLVVPHQANARITAAIKKEMNLTDDKIVSNIHKYGNTTAASVGIALCEAWEEGRIKDGDLVALAAFGSGFMWASAIIRW